MTETAEREVEFMCNFSDEIWENGKAEGQSLLNRLIEALTAQNRIDDLIRSTKDAEFQQQLLEEFGLI